jgi:hypothetical protein
VLDAFAQVVASLGDATRRKQSPAATISRAARRHVDQAHR